MVLRIFRYESMKYFIHISPVGLVPVLSRKMWCVLLSHPMMSCFPCCSSSRCRHSSLSWWQSMKVSWLPSLVSIISSVVTCLEQTQRGKALVGFLSQMQDLELLLVLIDVRCLFEATNPQILNSDGRVLALLIWLPCCGVY